MQLYPANDFNELLDRMGMDIRVIGHTCIVHPIAIMYVGNLLSIHSALEEDTRLLFMVMLANFADDGFQDQPKTTT